MLHRCSKILEEVRAFNLDNRLNSHLNNRLKWTVGSRIMVSNNRIMVFNNKIMASNNKIIKCSNNQGHLLLACQDSTTKCPSRISSLKIIYKTFSSNLQDNHLHLDKHHQMHTQINLPSNSRQQIKINQNPLLISHLIWHQESEQHISEFSFLFN